MELSEEQRIEIAKEEIKKNPLITIAKVALQVLGRVAIDIHGSIIVSCKMPADGKMYKVKLSVTYTEDLGEETDDDDDDL